MSLRRASAAASTIVVAIAIAVAALVPVAQLRTFHVVATCCCPDPDDCHCPQDKPVRGHEPAMRACHHTDQLLTAPQAPSAVVAVAAQVAVPPRAIAFATVAHDDPHATPPPRRPDAPS